MTAIRRFDMTHVLREAVHSLRASPVFAFYVLVTLGLAAFIGLMFGQMAWRLDVFLPGQFGDMAHGAAGSHRVHDLTYGLLVSTGIVGVLAQLRRPKKNVAGMVMALIPFAGLLLTGVLSADAVDVVVRRNPLYLVAAVAGIAALLHPAGRGFFRSFSVSRVNWIMLALVGIAAGPLLAFASTNIRLQGSVLDDHANLGHYGFMAAFSFTVIGVGVLASLRPDGWRLTAWVTGLLPALLGVWSVIFPDASSSFSLGWAFAAIVWGAAFVAVAELTRHAERLTPLRSRGVVPVSERG
jgi:hypothetical protein